MKEWRTQEPVGESWVPFSDEVPAYAGASGEGEQGVEEGGSAERRQRHSPEKGQGEVAKGINQRKAKVTVSFSKIKLDISLCDKKMNHTHTHTHLLEYTSVSL